MKKSNIHHELIYRAKIKDILSYNICICGCGAIGSNLAINLARQGFNNFTLIDDDRVENHNIGTQTYIVDDIGKLKVHSLEKQIEDIYIGDSFADNVDITTINKRITTKNTKLLKNSDIIVDCFDNTESRQILKDFGLKNNNPVIHAGLYEDYAEIFWNDQYKVPQIKDGLDVCDYPLARNVIVLLTAVLSEIIIRFFMSLEKENYSITLKDFSISKIY